VLCIGLNYRVFILPIVSKTDWAPSCFPWRPSRAGKQEGILSQNLIRVLWWWLDKLQKIVKVWGILIGAWLLRLQQQGAAILNRDVCNTEESWCKGSPFQMGYSCPLEGGFSPAPSVLWMASALWRHKHRLARAEPFLACEYPCRRFFTPWGAKCASSAAELINRLRMDVSMGLLHACSYCLFQDDSMGVWPSKNYCWGIP